MSKRRFVRIGTRDSKLATWQARHVAGKLEELGKKSELVFIKSEGDIDRETSLAELGGKGVFTKALDEALLNDEIDIAVHSHKDLPTENPLPLMIAAVLERGDPRDVLVAPDGTDFLDKDNNGNAVIATGSNRRKAQWLHRFPGHEIVDIRGNVPTRIDKIKQNEWSGGIFAAAGLQRIDLEHHIARYLDWMVPAAAQGAVAVMVREEDLVLNRLLNDLNHRETELSTRIERDFLHDMEAGCSAPVGAHARVVEGAVHFRAIALTMDGGERYYFEEQLPFDEAADLGHTAADELLSRGASEVVAQLKK